MRLITVVLFLVLAQIEAKTYYFNLNKTTNEFMVRNRVNFNQTNYPAIQISELRNNRNVTRKTATNTNGTKPYIHPLLDSEWNYNWTNITRNKLPSYIYKYYEAYSQNVAAPVHILFNANPLNSTIIKFNSSKLDVAEVELHFYHKVEANLTQKSLILRLYQVENDINETALINPDSHKLLNVIYIYQAESGWQVFKLTKSLHNWIKKTTDLSIFITISKPNDEQFNLFNDSNRNAFRTFLILKSESPRSDGTNDEITESNACRRHDLYVDFQKLNWMKFIISPAGYNAYNCHGTCYQTHHLPNHHKTTNFFPELGRKSPCCGPTKYAPLPIMFYDRFGNVMIKFYDEMVISACGCR
ncbi:derriere protein [Tribolium castaneum]|uniref:Bone morphogenetic protein 8B-like protein n=1 Tax=Tribolium castaneum TaxID=7070 RepID=A0A139WIK3_TRICA|nr:PREDICTED: derriere protein-like [Tribolium castaneum]KYB27762.1 Bone morphogenetic protein 8B-like protein [Tribolium castaneum]|eukprot:XP_015834538.1 PREDICTED: derriere protein-like [Tribolium castaneum]